MSQNDRVVALLLPLVVTGRFLLVLLATSSAHAIDGDNRWWPGGEATCANTAELRVTMLQHLLYKEHDVSIATCFLVGGGGGGSKHIWHYTHLIGLIHTIVKLKSEIHTLTRSAYSCEMQHVHDIVPYTFTPLSVS